MLRNSSSPPGGEPNEFESGDSAAATGSEPTESSAEPREVPPPTAQPPAAHPPAAKTWRWVRTPSPAAVIARALDPRSPPMRPASRPLDPVEVLARAVERPPARRTPGQTTGRREAAAADVAAVAAEAQQAVAQAAAVTDEAAFWQIWLVHRDYLRQHSLRLSSGNVADAEDALSEAMLRAAQAFSKSEIRNHRAWLLRLVHNACMDRYRSNHRYKQLAQNMNETAVQSAPAIAVRRDRTPEDLLAALEQIYDLQRAMSSLPPMLAEPLLLYLNDLTDGEIAGNLRVTKEVVRKRRQIARAWLRRNTSSF